MVVVDGESANSRRVLESLVFRPILPGPPPLGVHLFASMETLVLGKVGFKHRDTLQAPFSLNNCIFCHIRSLLPDLRRVTSTYAHAH
jgi:hypothetical protein